MFRGSAWAVNGYAPGAELIAAAADADPVTRLVLAWLAAKRSPNTRTAYARDIGITPQRRAGHAPSWLAWCQAKGIHPVTGVTGMHVALYARQLELAGLSPASAARRLAAVSSWYDWLARRRHIDVSPAAGIIRPRLDSSTGAAPGLSRDQALDLLHAADAAPGPQRARTAALVAVLMFTGALVCEVVGADIEDLGVEHARRVLRVARTDGRAHSLALPGPAAFRVDAYLAQRRDVAGPRTLYRPQGGQSHGAGPRRVLFATGTGGRLFAADVWRTVRRLAVQADLPDDVTSHLGPQAMRHTFASLYLEAGGSLRELHAVMGHAGPGAAARHDQGMHAGGPSSPGDVVAAYLAAPPHPARPAAARARNGG